MQNSQDTCDENSQKQQTEEVSFDKRHQKKFHQNAWMEKLHVYEILAILVAVVILALIVSGLVLFLYFIWRQIINLGVQIRALDAVIIAAIIAGVCSFLHAAVSKCWDERVKRNLLLFEKKVQTYENIVAFIFKYQKREGYEPDINWEEAQQACFSINQQVMLWASDSVREAWEKYLAASWRQDNDSYQFNASHVFERIAREIGTKFKKHSLYDWPYLALFYDVPSFKLLTKDLSVIYSRKG